MRAVPGRVVPYVKNYYETVLKKNRSENFLFYKSDFNKISIFSDLGTENSPPMLFTEIDNIKGERLTDFEIIDHVNLNFKQAETFNPQNLHQIENSESSKLNKMIIITISSDGFICPYMIQYQPESTSKQFIDQVGDNGIARSIAQNTLKRLKSPHLDLINDMNYKEELVKCTLSQDNCYLIVNSVLMAKPVTTIVNGQHVYQIPGDRMNKRNSRLFIFGLNQYMDSPTGQTPIDPLDFKLILLQSIDLHQMEFSHMPDSFFQIIRPDFGGTYGLKTPAINPDVSPKNNGLYIVCFTQSGGCNLVLLRLRKTGRAKVMNTMLPPSGDFELEMIGQVDDYHTRSVLSSQRTDGLLWTMDGNGVFKQLDWDMV